MSLQIGDMIRIESYKYWNHLHRIWKASTVCKIGEPLIVANQDSVVVEANGFEHVFSGFAVCVFSKVDWFHTVMIFDEQDQLERFYINIASPYPWKHEKTLQYTDFDLDLIVKPDFSYFWVDQEEYEEHKTLYRYPMSVQQKIKETQKELEQKILDHEEPFSLEFANHWYHQYRSLLKENDGQNDSKVAKIQFKDQ